MSGSQARGRQPTQNANQLEAAAATSQGGGRGNAFMLGRMASGGGPRSQSNAADQAGKQAASGLNVDVSQAATGEAQGDWMTGAIIGAALDDKTPEEEIAELQGRTFTPLLDYHPSSGGMFDVSFDAASLQLSIELKVGFDFINGDPSDVVAGFRAEEFEWTDDQKQDWRTRYMADASSTWSEQFSFRSTTEGWDAVQVGCVVRVIESDAVKNELTGESIGAGRLLQRNQGENNATDDEAWCRVDVRVGTHQVQDPAVHETGHMFGLGDEYGTAGTDVAAHYKTLLADQAGVEIKRGSTDSVMSPGSTVEQWHYMRLSTTYQSETPNTRMATTSCEA